MILIPFYRICCVLTRSYCTLERAFHLPVKSFECYFFAALCLVNEGHQANTPNFLSFLFIYYCTVTRLPLTLLRISQGESVVPSTSILFTLLTFREDSKLPEYQIVCLFAFPCHLVISAGIILYWLPYLRPSHSSHHLPLPGSDLHAGLHSIYMQRGSLSIPQFSELCHPLLVLTYWQVTIDC